MVSKTNLWVQHPGAMSLPCDALYEAGEKVTQDNSVPSCEATTASI
ncbi:unnamed protein product, partial [Gulo gulo]